MDPEAIDSPPTAGAQPAQPRQARMLLALICVMFLMFAMTTDSVGVIIPRIIQTFDVGLTAAAGFHYATMAGIAVAGLGLGFLADRIGRANVIAIGLGLFSATAFLVATVDAYGALLALLFASGVAIALFRTGAMALIGDLFRGPREHAAAMNAVEGFFGVGAVLGPLAVGALLASGASWRWLYLGCGALCLALLALTLVAPFPARTTAPRRASLAETLDAARDPFALAFGAALVLYVGVETAVYVWLPTLLATDTTGADRTAAYALSIFFGLRAIGRFLGAWLLARADWTKVVSVAAVAVAACFAGALAGGLSAALILLPLSGLFMSVIYPTVNARAIGGAPRTRQGATAGLMLFFTCVSAVLAPLAMGALGDRFGGPRPGFVLAAILAVLLAVVALFAMRLERRHGLFARRAATSG